VEAKKLTANERTDNYLIETSKIVNVTSQQR